MKPNGSKSFSIIFIISVLLCGTNEKMLAGNYTWTGASSTSWTEKGNWSSSTVPTINDTATIVTGSNNVMISAKTEVKRLIVNSGTVNLQGNELIVYNTSNFNGGTINNGLLTLLGTTHTFKGTTFGAKVYVYSNISVLSGSVFNDSLSIIKASINKPSTGIGGNTFNGPVTITNSSTGNILLADSFPDIFNSTLDLYNTSTATIFIAHRATGNQFNGTVKFNGPNIYSNYYGTATYSGNIVFNSSSGNIFFGYSTGSCTQVVGKKISIGSSGISSGQIYLGNFVSLDSSSRIALSFTGTSTIYFESGTKFYDSLDVAAINLYLNGSKFYGISNFEIKSSSSVTSKGGCYFAKKMSFTNNCTGEAVYSLANISTDTFALSSNFINKANNTFLINYGLFIGKVRIDNSPSGGEGFSIASTGTCKFKDSLIFNSSDNKGIQFGNSGGTTTIDSSGTLYFSSACTGYIGISNLTKLGNNPQNLQTTSYNFVLGPGNTWNGEFNFDGKNVQLNGNTFNSNVVIKAKPTSSTSSNGGNIFNGNTIIQDSSSTANTMQLAKYYSDDFNGDVSFIQKGSGVDLQPANTKNTTIAGRITIESSSTMNFGSNGGCVIMDGTGYQSFGVSPFTPTPQIKKLKINKSSNAFALNSPLTISDSLILTKGRINSDTTNLITLLHGCKLSGGSDSSYINGPMKKTGSSSFVFPLGSSTLAHPYHPLEITAPSSASDAYTAKYFSTAQTKGSAIDSTIDNLNGCQYWTLNRTAGTSKVKVKLSWNNDSCETISPTKFRVTGWNGSLWKDLGNTTTSGDSIKGSVQSVDSLNTISTLTVAFLKCSAFRKTIVKHNVKCNGGSDGVVSLLAAGATLGYSYLWSNGMGVSSITSNLRAGKYNFQISDIRGCILTDSVIITEPNPIVVASTLTKPNCNDSTGVIILNVSGGVGLKITKWPEFEVESDTLSGIPIGTYTYSIIDSAHCRVSNVITLDNDDGPVADIITQSSPVCFKGITGKVEIVGANGVAPYSYKWLNFHNDTSTMIKNIPAGTYIVEISDSLNCIGIDTIVLAQADTFALSFSVTNTPCNSSTGQIIPVIQGGARPFTYSWDTDISADSMLVNMKAGIHDLIITDTLGCQVKGRAEIISSSGISISASVISNAICVPDSGGGATVSVTGGAAPYFYSWQPNGGNNDTAFNLPPDHYTITVVDSNGCRQSNTFDIRGPKSLEAILSASLPSSDTTNDGAGFATCLGGTPPYEYLWSTGGTNDSIKNIGMGQYSFKVTDSKGCRSQSNLEINGVHTCYTCYPYDNLSAQLCQPTHRLICTTCMDPVYLNIEDFGADGSDDVSDQCAFEEVSNYINSLNTDVPKHLFIPGGTYYVGRQVEGYGSYYLSGVGVLCFQNINNLTISSTRDKAVLKFNNCMKYGAFDYPDNPDNRYLSDNGRLITCTITAGSTLVTYSGAPIDPSYAYTVWDPDPSHTLPSTKYLLGGVSISSITSTSFILNTAPINFTGTILFQLGIISDCRITGSDYSKIAHMGDMIHFNFCHNISISNLELDGNIDNTLIGGGGELEGLQHPYDGIFINASNDITVRNIDEHHFGHDGIWLRYQDCDIPQTASSSDMNCNLINCKFQYNGRNAISWTGGNGLYCSNSEFSFTGQSRIWSQPGAGMDIENEPIPNPLYYSQGNSRGIFQNCKFRFNLIHGFISDGGNRTRFTSNDYTFNQCDFVSGESADCLWPNVAGCHFTTCNFYGLLVRPFNNSMSLPFFTDFNDCTFENCYFGENYKARDLYSPPECVGVHCYTTTASETNYSSGLWVPNSYCPPSHKPQIDFSVATRVSFIGGLSEQGFTNKNIILGTSLGNIIDDDWNTINGTIFSGSGFNMCRNDFYEDLGAVLLSNTKIGLNHLFVPFFRPDRYTTTPTVNPWPDRYTGFSSSTYVSTTVNGVTYGNYYTNPYHFDLLELAPKFENLVVSNSAMPLYTSPCLSTPAFVPSPCIPPARHGYQQKKDFPSSLNVTPTISNEKIVVESSQLNDQCQIVNNLGEIVLDIPINNNSTEINISNLRAGFYMIKSNSGSVAKFIKY